MDNFLVISINNSHCFFFLNLRFAFRFDSNKILDPISAFQLTKVPQKNYLLLFWRFPFHILAVKLIQMPKNGRKFKVHVQ